MWMGKGMTLGKVVREKLKSCYLAEIWMIKQLVQHFKNVALLLSGLRSFSWDIHRYMHCCSLVGSVSFMWLLSRFLLHALVFHSLTICLGMDFFGFIMFAVLWISNLGFMYVCVCVCVCVSCSVVLTLCDLMVWGQPDSSVHGIFQARILEWIAILFSKGSFQARYQTRVSWTAGRLFTVWATREDLGLCVGGFISQVLILFIWYIFLSYVSVTLFWNQ